MSAPDRYTQDERAGDASARKALEKHREGVTIALQNRPGFDIADLSDEEFDAGLAREKLRQSRIRRIIMNDLVAGEDYGTVPGISKPFAWEGSADKLLTRLRWTCQPMGDPALTITDDYVMASVTVGVYDSMGRLLFSVPRSCSTMERRFKNQKTKKWKFDDAREAVNEVVSMAFKRGKIACTLSAAAAKGYFANPEQLQEDDATPDPWTSEQKQAFYLAAVAAGIKTKGALEAFLQATLGRDEVYGVDVEKLTAALATYKAPGVAPVKQATFDDEPAPVASTPAPATATPAATTAEKEEDDGLPF